MSSKLVYRSAAEQMATAGGFRDVFKLAFLSRMFKHMKFNSVQPWTFADVSCGFDKVDLQLQDEVRTAGFPAGLKYSREEGVNRLWRYEHSRLRELGLDHSLCHAMRIVKELNKDEPISRELRRTDIPAAVRYMPGTASIARHFASEFDRILLCEEDPDVFKALSSSFPLTRNDILSQEPAATVIKKHFPPVHSRNGLVNFDLSYTVYGGLTATLEAQALTIADAFTRWPEATYTIFYPLGKVGEERPVHFLRCLRRMGVGRILCAELHFDPKYRTVAPTGVGVAILNAKPEMAQMANALIKDLFTVLHPVNKKREKSLAEAIERETRVQQAREQSAKEKEARFTEQQNRGGPGGGRKFQERENFLPPDNESKYPTTWDSKAFWITDPPKTNQTDMATKLDLQYCQSDQMDPMFYKVMGEHEVRRQELEKKNKAQWNRYEELADEDTGFQNLLDEVYSLEPEDFDAFVAAKLKMVAKEKKVTLPKE